MKRGIAHRPLWREGGWVAGNKIFLEASQIKIKILRPPFLKQEIADPQSLLKKI